MKNFLKISGLIVVGLLVIIYGAFLFILPRYDINQYKADLQKIAKEQAKLDIDWENAKIVTTPLLGIGFKADNIAIKLPDGSSLLTADGIKTRISLPSLLLLTVKVSCAEVYSPVLNAEIVDDKSFKVIDIINDILNTNEAILEETAQKVETEKSGWFNPEWIRVKVPCVRFIDYKVIVNDLKSKHTLTLGGDELKFGYYNGKVIKVKTKADLFLDDKKNVTANVDIDTFLPPAVPLDEEDDKAQKTEISFVNPVTVYRNYDFKSNIDVKLKIRDKKKGITSSGYANFDNITLKISQLNLPESYLHITTSGHNADIDSDINIFENENINLLAKLNYSKHPRMFMHLKTDKIYFNDMIVLSKAVLDSLRIKNDLNKLSMAGYIQADTDVKTNFKKLKSNGYVEIKDGALTIRNVGKVIDDLKAQIMLDNNVLEVKDTSLILAGAKISASGKIDEKSVADIKINTDDRLSLPVLFNSFAPNDLKKSFSVKSGTGALVLDVKGQLSDAIADLDLDVANLSLGDRANTFNVSDKNFKAQFVSDKHGLKGNISNDVLKIYLPQTKSNIDVPDFSADVADKNINVPENKIVINNSTILNFKGYVKDYFKLSDVNMELFGDVKSSDLLKLAGSDYSRFLNAKGAPKLSVKINGNPKKQTVNAEVLADNANYFTPLNIVSLQGKDTSLRSTIDFKKGRMKIKNTGLYTKDKVVDEKGNEKIVYNEVLGIDGTIAGTKVNLLKVTMPEALDLSVQGLKDSTATIKGRLFMFGDMLSLHYRGGFDVTSISVPDILFSMDKLNLAFKGKELDIRLENMLANGSDFNIDTVMSLVPSANINISSMDIKSDLVDADKLMVTVDKAMALIPQASTTSNTQAQSADIPVVLKNGHFRGKKLKSGDIVTGQTTADFSINNNILVLNKLDTDVFDGKVKGDFSMNLVTSLMQIDVKGFDINVDKALVQACNMKDTLSGTTDFTADLSLKGATYEEQVKSLKGEVNFEAKDGQFGPFGKLENLIIAENIRESKFFQTTLGGVIDSIATIDTTHFDTLTGSIALADGVATINPIISKGDALALKLFGDMDILQNTANMKAQAKLTSTVANLLGPLNAINPINIMSNAGGMNVLTAKAFSLFCEAIPEEEMNAIPSFENSYINNNAMKFQLGIRGDLAKPLTLVKSFKWLALAADIEKAESFVEVLPTGKDGADIILDPKVIEKTKANMQKQAEKALKEKQAELKKQAQDSVNQKVEQVQTTVDNKIEQVQTSAQNKINEKVEKGMNSKFGQFLKNTKETIDVINSQLETTNEENTKSETVEENTGENE